jgi:large subunit ribosomal protein L4
VLVVAERTDELTWLSLRNIPTVHILEPGQLNTYDVLVSDDVVFTQGALDAFLAGPAKGKSAKGAASSLETESKLIKLEEPTGGSVEKLAEEPPAPAATEEAAAEMPAKKAPAKQAAAKKAPAKKAPAKKAEPVASDAEAPAADEQTEEEES